MSGLIDMGWVMIIDDDFISREWGWRGGGQFRDATPWRVRTVPRTLSRALIVPALGSTGKVYRMRGGRKNSDGGT